ncbi:MAG: hypothetical protein WDZ66_03160 [Steroidobacteraceae bacterium]
MFWSRGVELAPPSKWNRSRATALGVTLLLHAVLAAWLLALRFDLPPAQPVEADFVWLPAPPPPPRSRETVPALPPPRTEPITVISRPEPAPLAVVPPFYDFEGTAKDVAAAIGGGPSRRTFGGPLEEPGKRPREEMPPSIWPKPLPRVGTTVTTPEGETILWVSDYCYISLASRSLTMQDFHQARQGVRRCILYQFGGKKKPRDDLFDSIERPPKPQQEPGCGPGGDGQSCAP